LRVPDTSVQCERYGDRVAARKVRDWRVLHAASGDAEEYPSEKDQSERRYVRNHRLLLTWREKASFAVLPRGLLWCHPVCLTTLTV